MTGHRLALLAALSAASLASLLLVAPSCSEETIPLFSLPQSDSGVSMGTQVPCFESDACAPGMYCERPCSDGGAIVGYCRIAEVVCNALVEAPVCGCDGVTYANDCFRQQAGVGLHDNQGCQDFVRRCGSQGFGGGGPVGGGGGGFEGCPPGSACLAIGDCSPRPAQGTCWHVPDTCPDAEPGQRWDSCIPGEFSCLGTCAAIKTGLSVRPSECP